MIEILNISPNVLAYRIEGAIDREDIDRAFAEVDEKLAGEGSIRVYVELRSITGVSVEALLRDLWLGIQRLNLLPRLEKSALVTDLEWLRRMAGMPDMIFPGLQLKAYSLAEQPEAWAWIKA